MGFLRMSGIWNLPSMKIGGKVSHLLRGFSKHMCYLDPSGIVVAGPCTCLQIYWGRVLFAYCWDSMGKACHLLAGLISSSPRFPLEFIMVVATCVHPQNSCCLGVLMGKKTLLCWFHISPHASFNNGTLTFCCAKASSWYTFSFHSPASSGQFCVANLSLLSGPFLWCLSFSTQPPPYQQMCASGWGVHCQSSMQVTFHFAFHKLVATVFSWYLKLPLHPIWSFCWWRNVSGGGKLSSFRTPSLRHRSCLYSFFIFFSFQLCGGFCLLGSLRSFVAVQ